MTQSDLIAEFAALLGVERPVALSTMEGFFRAMQAELLVAQKLSLKGVGSFQITHTPLQKTRSSSGIVYTPPCNKVLFERRMSGRDDSVRLAVSRLSMSEDEALRFSRSFAAVFSRALKEQREVTLNGFGRFSSVNGRYGFLAEPAMEQLLNCEYINLREIVLSGEEGSLRPGRERNPYRYFLSLFALLILIVLAAVFYWKPLHIFALSTAEPPQRVSGVAAEKAPEATGKPSVQPRSPERLAGGAADSVTLEQGEYTLVLATFRREKTAIKELAPLRAQGITTFVWPASVDGVDYYRLMTGKFSTYAAAAEQMKRLPKKVAARSYIQHVIKRVILHGEKEL